MPFVVPNTSTVSWCVNSVSPYTWYMYESVVEVFSRYICHGVSISS